MLQRLSPSANLFGRSSTLKKTQTVKTPNQISQTQKKPVKFAGLDLKHPQFFKQAKYDTDIYDQMIKDRYPSHNIKGNSFADNMHKNLNFFIGGTQKVFASIGSQQPPLTPEVLRWYSGNFALRGGDLGLAEEQLCAHANDDFITFIITDKEKNVSDLLKSFVSDYGNEQSAGDDIIDKIHGKRNSLNDIVPTIVKSYEQSKDKDYRRRNWDNLRPADDDVYERALERYAKNLRREKERLNKSVDESGEIHKAHLHLKEKMPAILNYLRN